MKSVKILTKHELIKRIMHRLARDERLVWKNSQLIDYQEDYFLDVANDGRYLLTVYKSSENRWAEPAQFVYIPLRQYRKYHKEGLFKLTFDHRVTKIEV